MIYNKNTQNLLIPLGGCDAKVSNSECNESYPKHISSVLLVMLQMSKLRDFKNYYTGFLAVYHKNYFPSMPSYERFIAIMNRAIFPLTIFTQVNSGRKRTGIYDIESSCLPVCHLKRSKQHKKFDAIAEYGRTSAGWFLDLNYIFKPINFD